MINNPKFSIILPTYLGTETINKTFESILKQRPPYSCELIIVIDGPDKELNKICSAIKPDLIKKNIAVTIKQLPKNRGRFFARLEGAKLAKTDQLLFVDDRITLDKNYFSNLLRSKSLASMPSVIEVEQKITPISLTLKLIRKYLYKGKWGEDFEDHYVDSKNFESLPKGSGGLWIPKKVFITACQSVANTRRGSEKYTHDDTRILKETVNMGIRILRSSRLIIYYYPRTDLRKEIRHLFDRGIRFVDYYSRPKTRFFPIFVGFYLVLVGLIAIIALWPTKTLTILLVLISGLLATAIFISGLSRKVFPTILGVILIVFIFGAGITKGTYFLLFTVKNKRLKV